ncbi:MAG TPA: hypothetical protein VD813_14710 [Pseudonocardia sp.]|nr:hypothetical protein [Pseudonocardia sp.]
MTSPEPPVPSRSRRRRRVLVLAAATLALLVAGGATAAALVPDRDDVWRGGIEHAVEAGEPDGWGAHGRGGPGGPRGLGDDAVLAGSVVSAGGGSLVVAVDGGGERTLRTDDDTRVRGVDDRTLGDLEPGERVGVRVDGSGDQARAVTVWVPVARVVGTVTEVSGDRVTVTAVDGLTVTVDVSGLSDRPAAGDVVMLSGAATDGGTIRADRVRELPKAS